MGSFTVASTGYVALDVIRSSDGVSHRAGGTAANVAAILSYMGWKAEVIGAVGEDAVGRALKSDLARASVGVRGLRLEVDRGTPLIVHEFTAKGSQYKFGCRTCGRAYRSFRPLRDPVDAAQGLERRPDVLFVDRAGPSTVAMAVRQRELGGLVVYEPGSRGRLDWHRRALQVAHVVKFSEERRPLFEVALGDPVPEGQLRIETRGSQGATFRQAGVVVDVPAVPTVALDTTGAGDWFTAVVLNGAAASFPMGIERTAAFASAVAAIACAAPGARGIAEVVAWPSLLEMAADVVEGAPIGRLRSPATDWPFGVLVDDRCPRCYLPYPD